MGYFFIFWLTRVVHIHVYANNHVTWGGIVITRQRGNYFRFILKAHAIIPWCCDPRQRVAEQSDSENPSVGFMFGRNGLNQLLCQALLVRQPYPRL